MIKIKNYSSIVSNDKIIQLEKALNTVEELEQLDLTIEVWDSALQAYTPREIKFIKKINPAYNPEKSDAEVWKGKIRIFACVFKKSFITIFHIATHEIGHFLNGPGSSEKVADEFSEFTMKKFFKNKDVEDKVIGGSD